MSAHGCSVNFGLDCDMSVANCLLSMYVGCGSVELARKLFDGMSKKGLITWQAMISGYSQNGLANEVLDLYREMEIIGREVEEQMALGGFGSNPFLQNSLTNMYARCGNLLKARALFEDMPYKSIITWTAIIGGYGLHGHGETAVDLFDKMIKTGIRPDGAVFPGVEHYACIIDLLGRAGRFDQAKELIGSMKIKPDGAVWGALLGACKIHKNVDLAKLTFEKVIELEPANIGYHVLISNLYADVEDMDGVS
ncbi:Pentatricopeptide repeat [Dillenia turbinata]|uniref:Pentatricopeptide repeat n=1 Tax=Dillenia turbinata TaxID=194707 RepID=A0AAN8W995_9MAGN